MTDLAASQIQKSTPNSLAVLGAWSTVLPVLGARYSVSFETNLPVRVVQYYYSVLVLVLTVFV
jgi:hypothetical protein